MLISLVAIASVITPYRVRSNSIRLGAPIRNLTAVVLFCCDKIRLRSDDGEFSFAKLNNTVRLLNNVKSVRLASVFSLTT